MILLLLGIIIGIIFFFILLALVTLYVVLVKVYDKTPSKKDEELRQKEYNAKKEELKEKETDIYLTQINVLLRKNEKPDVKVAAIWSIYNSGYQKDTGFRLHLQTIIRSPSEDEKVKVAAIKVLNKI